MYFSASFFLNTKDLLSDFSAGNDYCSFDCPSCGCRTAADRPSSNPGFAPYRSSSSMPYCS
jgi:hypothetical protein